MAKLPEVSESVREALLANIKKSEDWAGVFQLHHVITRKAAEESRFIENVYGRGNKGLFNKP